MLTIGADVYMLTGEALYKYCVRPLNKRKLSGKKDTVWMGRLSVQDECKRVWRLLYKVPSNKRSGDLLWGFLQGALAVNSSVLKINPTVSAAFHVLLRCKRLSGVCQEQ